MPYDKFPDNVPEFLKQMIIQPVKPENVCTATILHNTACKVGVCTTTESLLVLEKTLSAFVVQICWLFCWYYLNPLPSWLLVPVLHRSFRLGRGNYCI